MIVGGLRFYFPVVENLRIRFTALYGNIYVAKYDEYSGGYYYTTEEREKVIEGLGFGLGSCFYATNQIFFSRSETLKGLAR